MIIVLNKADFSQNNIGKITLPEEKYQYLDITTEVLSRFSKTFSSTQEKALDNFFRQLSNAGILSKIKILLLPLLASDVNEACMNVLNGEIAVTNFDSLTLTSKGVKPIIGQPIAWLNYNSEESFKHIATYVNSIGNYIEIEGSNKAQFALATLEYVSMGKNLTNGNQQPCIQMGITKKIAYDVNYANNNSSLIASYSESENKLLGSVGGEFQSVSLESQYTSSEKIAIGEYPSVGGQIYADETNMFPAMKSEQSIISLGDFIDEAQHLTYNTALENLNNAFLI